MIRASNLCPKTLLPSADTSSRSGSFTEHWSKAALKFTLCSCNVARLIVGKIKEHDTHVTGC